MLKVVSVHTDTVSTRLDGISDIEVVIVDGMPILLIGSEAESAVTSFTLERPVNPDQVSQIDYSDASGTRVLTEIEVYERNGVTQVLTLGRFDDQYGHYELDNLGNLELTGSFGDEAGPTGGIVAEMISTSAYPILATSGYGTSGLRLYRINTDDTVVALRPTYDKTDYRLGDVVAMDSATLNNQAVLATASALDAGIHIFSVRGDGKISSQFVYEPSDGLGFNAITDIQFVAHRGKDFLLVAAAGTHSLSVLRYKADYSLTETDSYIDTAETRFASVTCMKSFSYEDRTFILVAGADEGVTLFELDYRGRLTLLDVITDDFDTTLANVSDMDVHLVDNLAYVYVGSSQDHGYTVLKFDMERSGEEVFGNKYSNKNKQGTAGDDIIWGKEGHDNLYGNGGDDRLIDGFGRDKMTGGWGEDVFVFIPDSKKDWILDFQPGIDRIDLSEYDNLWHISSLEFDQRKNGSVVIFVGDDKIHVVAKNGETISEDSFTQDDFIFG